jgi:hypothetical protein
MYERSSRLYACSRVEDYGIPITNFTVRPVMQVIGSAESRVLLELKNIKGMKAKMEVNTDAMTEIGPFKKEILRRGFFVFDESAKPFHYNRILSWLFDDMKHCHPLTVLGWNESQKFYAWANGLSLTDGTFKKVDEYGIVQHGDHSFFLPAFSTVHTSNPGDDEGNGYENMRGFVLDTDLNAPTLTEWAELFTQVHGDNGKIGIAFYLSCIFRSYIFDQFRCFPLLNLFGPPGLGKSFMAQSVAAMWGESRSPFNLHDGTDVGLFRRMAQMKDGVVFLDEFNNQILPKRFQACKNFYDGAGREKGQKTQDNRTTTTPVTSGVMLVGQQQPTQDPAMFSRVVSLNFGPREFSEEAKERARKLKSIEGTTALSQITAKLLTHRDYVKQNYLATYDEVMHDINKDIPKEVPRNVVARLTKNNAMLLASFKLLCEKEEFGFTYKELRDIMHRVMVKQLFAIGQEDDQATWWEMIQFALRKAELQHGRDLLVEACMEIDKVDVVTDLGKKKETIEWGGQERHILFLHLSTAYRVYSRLMRQEGKDNGMPKSSILHYLRGSEGYLGEKPYKIDGTTKRCMLFDVSRLGLEIQLSSEWNADPGPGEKDVPPDKTPPPPKKDNGDNDSSTGMTPEEDLPF